MKRDIIGISGKIGSGKDTFASMFRHHSEYSWEIKKFAYKLKQIVSLLTNIPIEELEKEEVKNAPLNENWRRWFFVNNGIDHDGIFKDFTYPDYFASEDEAKKNHKYLVEISGEGKYRIESEVLTPRKILQILGTEAGRDLIHPQIWVNCLFADLHENSNWLITDVRFPNEAKAIKDNGGILIRINRKSDKISNHPSETSLDNYSDWDFIVDNIYDLNYLEQQIISIVKNLNL